jgi:hypothetical protein
MSLMQAWWAAPIGRAVSQGGSGTSLAMGRFSPLVFVAHGVTPAGYAAFAAVQIVMPLWIRPVLFTPSHATTAIGRDLSFNNDQQGHFTLTAGSLPGQPGAWILSSRAVNAAGHPVSAAPAACTRAVVSGAEPASLDCLASHGIRVAVSYQPASRYWRFQWTETGIFLAAALALAGYCFRRLSCRLS